MRRSLLAVLAVALVAASAAVATPTRLRVMALTPVMVRGTSFHPGEHVLVVVAAGKDRASRRLVAGTRGGFNVRFPSLRIASCTFYSVRATGDQGSRSALKIIPECPTPLAP